MRRRRFSGRAAVWIFGGLLLLGGVPYTASMTPSAARSKKLIYYGSGIRDAAYVREHWAEIENLPFDGIGIAIAIDPSAPTFGDGSTGNLLGWQLMGERRFELASFAHALADLRQPRWRRLTENFLAVALSPAVSAAGLDWFDEERWRIIAANFHVFAELAARSGLRGLILDPEHYSHHLFDYRRQKRHRDRTFAAYERMARQRGRQLMRAISGPLRKPMLLALFGYSLPFASAKRRGDLASAEYGLLPALYDGMLEEMPDGGQLVDGYEFAYAFRTEAQFRAGYREIHGAAVTLSAVPDLYRRHVRAAFGLWFDDPREATRFRPDELRRAVRDALATSDEYVWIYGEDWQVLPPGTAPPSMMEALRLGRQLGTR